MNLIEKLKHLSYKNDLDGLNIGFSKSAFSDMKNERRSLKAIDALMICWEKDISLTDASQPFLYRKIYSRPQSINFWENLDAIFTTQKELKDFFSLCELNTNSLILNRGRNISPSLEAAQTIAQYLNTSIFLLFSDELDIECVQRNLNNKFNKKIHIPNIFTTSSGSKMRTFTHLVSYSRNTLDKFLVKEILMKMQISEEAVRNYSKDINIYTFECFYSFLLKFGVTEKFFLSAGSNSVNFKKNKSHFTQLLNPKNVKDVYKDCIKVISTVDRNFDYQVLELSDNHCLLSTAPKVVSDNVFVKKGLFSRSVLLFRIGHLIATPRYFEIDKGCLDKTSFTYDLETGKAIIKIIF